MRCTSCHSYIPEGLPVPVICPQCGRGADAQAPAGPPPLPTREVVITSIAPSTPSPAVVVAAPAASSAAPEVAPPLPATSSAEATDLHSRLGLDRASAPAPLSGPAETEAFAPYFSLLTTLAFSPASSNAILQHPSRGSLSFGPQGLSIVFDDGRNWEKFYYRDITTVRQQDDHVLISQCREPPDSLPPMATGLGFTAPLEPREYFRRTLYPCQKRAYPLRGFTLPAASAVKVSSSGRGLNSALMAEQKK